MLLETPPYCLGQGSTLLDLVVEGSGDSSAVTCDVPEGEGNGSMPPGVSVDPDTCAIEGAPTDDRYGTRVFMVRGTHGQNEVWAPYYVTNEVPGNYAIDVQHSGLGSAALVPQLHTYDPSLPLEVGMSGDPYFAITDSSSCGVELCFFGFAFSVHASPFDAETFDLIDAATLLEEGSPVGLSHGLRIEGPSVVPPFDSRPWALVIGLDYCLSETELVCDGAENVQANGGGRIDVSLLMIPES